MKPITTAATLPSRCSPPSSSPSSPVSAARLSGRAPLRLSRQASGSAAAGACSLPGLPTVLLVLSGKGNGSGAGADGGLGCLGRGSDAVGGH